VELRQLELFVGVANELHFGRAADRLYIAQSALSQHIRRLEREVGVELFDRGKRQVRLTPAGTAFYAEARRVLDRAEQARRAACAAALGHVGVLELGFSSTTSPRVLAGLLGAGSSAVFREVRLRELTGPRIEGDLHDDVLDIAVIDGTLCRHGLEELTVNDEPFVAVVHPAAHLQVGPTLALTELHNDPFVLPRSTWAPHLASTILATCYSAGFRPAVVAEADSPSGWMVPVVAGQAVTLAPVSVASRWAPDVRLIPLVGPTPRAITTLVWRSSAPPHIHAFANRVQKVLAPGGAPHSWFVESLDGAPSPTAGPKAA
jgi:DNA-binding transcriptional LysR family regulator